MKLLIYTDRDDYCLDTWDNEDLRADFPDVSEWVVCYDIKGFKEQVEGKDLVFIDGGHVGDHVLFFENVIRDHPQIHFCVTGGLSFHYYKKMQWDKEELWNVDFSCIHEIFYYLEKFIEKGHLV